MEEEEVGVVVWVEVGEDGVERVIVGVELVG